MWSYLVEVKSEDGDGEWHTVTEPLNWFLANQVMEDYINNSQFLPGSAVRLTCTWK